MSFVTKILQSMEKSFPGIIDLVDALTWTEIKEHGFLYKSRHDLVASNEFVFRWILDKRGYDLDWESFERKENQFKILEVFS